MRVLIAAIVLFIITAPNAGPNAGAGLYVDFIYTTPQIDSLTDPRGKSDLWVAITARGVRNLDAFNVDVVIDTAVLAYRGYMKDNQMQGVGNLLEKNGGSALVFVAGTPDTNSTTITILGSLQGEDTVTAPEGDGLLALIRFSIRREAPTVISLNNADLKDPSSPADSIAVLGRGRLTLSTAVVVANRPGGVTMRGTAWNPARPCDLMGRALVHSIATSAVQVRRQAVLVLR